MVIDTNILIAYLKGDADVVAFLSSWRKEGRALFVSSIIRAEVLALPSLSGTELNHIKDFLDEFIPVPFDDVLAEKAAALKRLYAMELPDCLIAATALERRVPLVTRDKQFRKIKELEVITV